MEQVKHILYPKANPYSHSGSTFEVHIIFFMSSIVGASPNILGALRLNQTESAP